MLAAGEIFEYSVVPVSYFLINFKRFVMNFTLLNYQILYPTHHKTAGPPILRQKTAVPPILPQKTTVPPYTGSKKPQYPKTAEGPTFPMKTAVPWFCGSAVFRRVTFTLVQSLVASGYRVSFPGNHRPADG